MATKTPAPSTPESVLDDFRVSTARAPMFTYPENVKRAPVRAHHEHATVARAARTSDGAPFLVCSAPGIKDTAIPLSAVGAALAHGIITREEIAALLGES